MLENWPSFYKKSLKIVVFASVPVLFRNGFNTKKVAKKHIERYLDTHPAASLKEKKETLIQLPA